MNKRFMEATFHWGLIVSILLTGAMVSILTTLSVHGAVPESRIGVYSILSQIIVCTIGFVITGKMAKKRIAIQIFLAATCYLAIFVFIGLVILNGSLQNIGSIILSITIAVLLSCALCIRKTRSGTIRKRGYRT